MAVYNEGYVIGVVLGCLGLLMSWFGIMQLVPNTNVLTLLFLLTWVFAQGKVPAAAQEPGPNGALRHDAAAAEPQRRVSGTQNALPGRRCTIL